MTKWLRNNFFVLFSLVVNLLLFLAIPLLSHLSLQNRQTVGVEGEQVGANVKETPLPGPHHAGQTHPVSQPMGLAILEAIESHVEAAVEREVGGNVPGQRIKIRNLGAGFFREVVPDSEYQQ